MKEILEEIKIQTEGREYKAAFDHHDDSVVFLEDERYDIKILKEYGNDVYALTVNGKVFTVKIDSHDDNKIDILATGFVHEFTVRTQTSDLLEKFIAESQAGLAGAAGINAPMPGMVVQINCSEGDEINEGDKLIIIEAMKMENALEAPASGTVKKINVEEGQAVDKNTLLIEIE